MAKITKSGLVALYVRVDPKKNTEAFYRCAMAFTRQWRKVEVDAATAERLLAEQMLQAVREAPADYSPEALADAPADPVQHMDELNAIEAAPAVAAATTEATPDAPAAPQDKVV